MSHTSELADFAAGLRYDDIPESARAMAKRVTLDLVGVVLPAVHYGPGRIMNDYVRTQGAGPRATVIGTDVVTAPSLAALANGTMAADMEQDDVHPQAGTHPSSIFVPALLGVAEDVKATGEQWITSLVVAYEVGSRLSIAMDHARLYSKGFHPTAITGTFGAAGAVATMLGLDSAGVNSAIGLAGCQAAGLMTWEMEQEHFTKSFQSGVPARNAVTAGELAALGYQGALDTLDGKYNAFDAFSTHRDFERLTAGLGESYEIERTGFKFYSACRNIHATLDVVLELVQEHQFEAEDVESIHVWLPETLAPIVDNNVLTTHNLQFVVAVAIFDGEVGRAQTSAERRIDPDVQALASRITLRADAELQKIFPEHWPTRVHLTLKDGRRFEVEREDPRGNAARPVTDGDIEEKFIRMASQTLPAAEVQSVLACVQKLETLSSMHELTALLRTSSRSQTGEPSQRLARR
ncbi:MULTISPECIES: MmgE/PrpD family protein [unclassified Nocardioides]|uniref:MmgE/PrpD family protein n=1 Tax=unclassified Nocardioides TaxID=2615069 RepID=UPI0009F0BF92|nr:MULTISPECIES: MmgE/PrpD family protein [unclassified Nocardioides]GAW47873.1 MmgE/PrpD family protein [Nocardioides sp. PD653-B2]GAW53825.1 MmgE/PrpD family protein [Nocardioides sp. PD653]